MARKLVKEKVGKTNQNQLVTAEVHRLVDNLECLELPRSCEYQLGNLQLPPLEQNLPHKENKNAMRKKVSFRPVKKLHN